MKHLVSNGTVAGTSAPAEERGIAGEELWWPPGGSAGVVVTEQTALQMSALLATVNVIATDTAVLPLGVHQTMPDGTCRAAVEHGNHEILRRSPDGQSTPLRWRQSWMLHALTYGGGFAEIQRTGRGQPYALHLLDPATTRPARDRDRALTYQIGGVGGRTLPASDVLHIAGIGFDGVSGFNMVRLLRQSIGLGIAEETFAADYFANGSESGGTIEVPGRLKDNEAVVRLRDRWEGRHQGPGRRHRVAVLEDGAKYSATSTEPDKAQLLESRKFQVIDTTRVYRVPPHKIGDLSEAHLANIAASNLDYLMSALMGWLVVIEQELNLKLFTRAEWLAGYRVKHDTTELLRGDPKSRYESYKSAITDGWMTRNQARKSENLDPMAADQGGDTYTVQMQVVALTADGAKPPDMAPKPAYERSESRFNPNHSHSDGKFSGGKGGGGNGGAGAHLPPERVSALKEQVARGAAAKGADMTLDVRPPANEKESRYAAKVARYDAVPVRHTLTAKVSETREGNVTAHRAGGYEDAAVTRPRAGKPGWVSETSALPHGGKRAFDTEEQALAHSRKHADREARKQSERMTVPVGVKGDRLERHLADAIDNHRHKAGTFSQSFEVIAP